MDANTVYELIDEGHNTNKEITAALDSSVGHVGRELKRMTEDGLLEREKDGHAYVYKKPSENGHEEAITAQPAGTTGQQERAGQAGEDRMPVNRNYTWSDHIPSEAATPEYIAHNGEKEEIQAEITHIRTWVEDVAAELGSPTPDELVEECRRREKAADEYAPRLPRYLITGPTGCGKTTLAEFIAATMGWPVIEIQFTYDMSPAELLGSPTLVGGDTVWEDGPLTQALLASREGPVMLVLDEVPRARPEVHSTLMDALDHRARVKLAGRGGEVVQGVPHNLYTVATANMGDEYQGFEMDPAHKRRLGDRHAVDYLGVNHPEREAQLLVDRTDVCRTLADLLVETANQVRERANDPTSDVSVGLPTSALIDWAQKGRALHEGGMDNAVMRAAKSLVVRRWYDDTQQEADTVRQVIRDNLDGCPYPEDEVREWAGDTEYVTCSDCDYWAAVGEAEAEGVLDFMECPTCSGHVTRKSAQEMH